MIFFQRFLVTKRNDGWPYEHIRKFCKKPDSFPRFWSQRIEKFVTKRKSKSSLRCPCFSFGRCAQRPRCNHHIAVTILVNASKPRFKGSYSDGIRDNGRKKSDRSRSFVKTSFRGLEPNGWSCRTDRSVSCQGRDQAFLPFARHAAQPSPDAGDESRHALSVTPPDIRLSNGHVALLPPLSAANACSPVCHGQKPPLDHNRRSCRWGT